MLSSGRAFVRERLATGLPEGTRVAGVSLRVASLKRSLELYSGLLGLTPVEGRDGVSVLAGAPESPGMLTLIEEPSAGPRAINSSGLYHVAFRFDSRKSLAQALRRLLDRSYPLQGAADHGVSEAVYLDDPEGNGVEIYADRPREEWTWSLGQVRMVSEPLDIDGLLAESIGGGARSESVAPFEIGHLHLQVTDLSRSSAFYHDVLGFDITQSTYPGAVFLSAGGYHHHIGINVWGRKDRAEMPASGRGLVGYRISIPRRSDLEVLVERMKQHGVAAERCGGDDGGVKVFDPDRIPIELVTGKGRA